MASNLIVARGGVEYVPPISLAFWRWTIVFLILFFFNFHNLIKKSIKTGWLIHGPENVKFENNFSKLIGSKYSISMNSCTSALECAIKCLEKKGWSWTCSGKSNS